MSYEFDNNQDGRDRVRIFVTGCVRGPRRSCARRSASTPSSSSSARAERVADGAGALAGGHLGAVLHATPGGSLPADDIAAIREYTRAPILLLASVESTAPARGGARGRRGRRPPAPAADRERRLRDPQGDAHAGRRAQARRRPRRGRIVTVFSPEGRDGQDRDGDEPRRLAREAARQAHAPARPRPPVRRRRDHARSRAGEDDPRPRHRAGRARLREARRLHHRGTRPGSTSCRRRCAPRTPSSSPRRSSPACSRSRASRTT